MSVEVEPQSPITPSKAKFRSQNLKINVPQELYIEITGQQLKELLQSTDNVLVVDVRNEDYEGGHIRNSINIPFTSEKDQLDHTLHEIYRQSKQFQSIVFVCMYGQQRSQDIAYNFAQYLMQKKESKKLYTLNGGFYSFLKSDKQFCVDYDEAKWKNGVHVKDDLLQFLQ